MQRKTVLFGLKKHGSKLGPLFLLAGLILIACVPALKPRKNFVDENAIKVDSIPVDLNVSDFFRADATVHKEHSIVYGRRSVGSESIAVYVNTDKEASIILGNFLIAAIRKKTNMGCDTHFYFVKENVLHWPVPNSFVRAALIINVSSLNTDKLCFGVYGENGMQPNQDLFNVALLIAEDLDFTVDLLCQNPQLNYSASRSKYEHYFLALQTALIAPHYHQPWYVFRSRGISALAISTADSDDFYNYTTAFSLSILNARIIGTLSYLDERFHHSTSVWIPLSVKEYVEYDIAQFGIIFLVVSLVLVGYSIYEVEGLSFSLFAVLIWVAPYLASLAVEFYGITGLVLSSIVMTAAWFFFKCDLLWLTINAVVLCLFIILQPAAGLFVGSGVATQLVFLHVKCRGSPALALVGLFFAWVVFAYFLEIFDWRICDTKTIGGMYFSFFVYPNAIWVSSRLLSSIFAVKQVE